MPYIYSLAGHSYFNDYTIMRGLVMDFNSDQKVHTIADQYMFGPSLLVNPVTEYKARSREVYLPATSGWYDFYTGEFFKGGQTISANAPIDRMPLYVKAGSIIPTGPEIQFTAEKPADPITLYVFTGSDASFSLYEDENVNYNYEQDKYAVIPFNYDEAKHTLTIGRRVGAFPDMTEKRSFQIVWVNASRPVGVQLFTQPKQVVDYSGELLTVSME